MAPTTSVASDPGYAPLGWFMPLLAAVVMGTIVGAILAGHGASSLAISVGAAAPAAIVALLMLIGLTAIRHLEVMVVERWGRFHHLLHPGFHILWPIIERWKEIEWSYPTEDFDGRRMLKTYKSNGIDMREWLLDFPHWQVVTKDNAFITVNTAVSLKIKDAQKAAYVAIDPLHSISVLIQSALRDLIGTESLDATLVSREQINTAVLEKISVAADAWGIKIERIELQDIVPPTDVLDAMEKELNAERGKRAAIINAEGYVKSRELIAESDAAWRTKLATAEATAIACIADALQVQGEDRAKYTVAMRHIETLRELAAGPQTKVVYLPYESTSVLRELTLPPDSNKADRSVPG